MILNKIKPFLYLGGLYLLISIGLRLVFFAHPITTSHFGITEILGILIRGIVVDIPIFILISSFLAIYFLFLSNAKYNRPWGVLILAGMILLFLYIWLIPNNIFRQYGGSLVEIALSFVGMKTLIFAIMLFLPKQRQSIRRGLYSFTLFLYVLLIIFNAVSEYFFWNEFGVRYNFIAVDYLIYTNEVIGNILESYPIIPLFSVILVTALVLTFYIYQKTKDTLLTLPNLSQKLILLFCFLLLSVLSIWAIPKSERWLPKENHFATEIQANGVYKFYYAFTHNELDFFQFYPTMPRQQAAKLYLNQFQPSQLERIVKGRGEELHKNVVLISIESLSADFMKHYGNEQNITPFLDSLANHSLMFTQLYAAGNRTVRGLEALTLCIPPTAGESVIKRKNNKDKFTTGSIFKQKGYQVKYLYGGYSYFDNMKDFFGGNGYDIVDRDHFSPEEITFANVWGVCDEDMARKAIQVMNKEAQAGKPFFNHWMTVSNHRPFTYPEGKIDIPGNAKSREGGVKYTDYALKQFFAMAKKQTWYKNTIFVIVADHCASSAGKTELPMDKYRIPAIVFSEGFIKPQKFTGLMSQIDLMPTVLGLLNFNYRTKFLGQDVFTENYQPRAYIATYQDLGLIKENKLTIISPIRKVKQYQLKHQYSELPEAYKLYYDEIPVVQTENHLVQENIATYEMVSFWLKHKILNR
ncbi:LTA synthase family protein [Riemerella columbina]|uniref:LTA synthase family protein n=1 Tax=Riemerella columbina TaxID=103810 RepID=UPI002670489E|nr:alkaline phosphatase family protein [Riemerella columbina]WKS95214.1 sulfatase-like hydrolase/transferase [Riemerella columbina]